MNPPSTEVVLSSRGLSVRFGGVHALTDIDLDVRRGTVHGLIGPNGAGKTTLVDALTGFQRRASGAVWLNGLEVTGWPPHRLAQAGLARTFQTLELYRELTVAENLESAMEACGRSDRQWLDEVVTLLDLRDLLPRRVREIPHGLQRLVSVGRSLATRPSVLILDEPAAGLDSEETDVLRDRLHDIVARDCTVVLIDHDIGFVAQVCDVITVLVTGLWLCEGLPDDILTNVDVRRHYLGEL